MTSGAGLTLSSRPWSELWDWSSATRVRVPKRRVSWRPKELAVSVTEAVLGALEGTMRYEGSCGRCQ